MQLSRLGIFLFFIDAYFVSVIAPSGRSSLAIAVSVIMIFLCIVRLKINFGVEQILWMMTLIVLSLNIYRTHMNWTFIIMYLPFVLMLFALKQDISWMILGYKINRIAGVFFAVCTVVPLVSKSLYESILYPLLLENETFDPLMQIANGNISGFTYQTAVNAQYLAIGLGAMLLPLVMKKKLPFRTKIVIVGLCIFELICLLFTKKRSFVLFSVVAILLTVYINSNRSKRFTNIMKGIALISIIILILFFCVPSFATFFERFFISSTGDLSNGRFVRYVYGWELFKQNPVFGIGWAQYRYHYIKYSDVHNIYIQLLCETGIVGTVIFLMAFLYSLIKGVKKLLTCVKFHITDARRELLFYAIFVQLLFLMYGIVGNGLYDYYIYYFYAFAVAITCLLPVETTQRMYQENLK